MKPALQKLIIKDLINQAISMSDGTVKEQLEALNKKLEQESIPTMKEVFDSVNNSISTLEDLDEAKPTIAFLKSKGLYRMLYRFPKYKGEELGSDDVLHRVLRYGFGGIAISALVVGAFVASTLFGAPFWVTALSTGLFVGASAYLGGLMYGVVNDLFATHANLPYFLLGHQPQQKSVLRTNNKIAQAVAWGVAASYGPVLLVSIVFTIAATIAAFYVPMATFIMPALIIAMPMIAVGADFYAQQQAKNYLARGNIGRYAFDVRPNAYQNGGMRIMSSTQKKAASWAANFDRNNFGFTYVPLIGLIGLVGLITLSAMSMSLPAALFTAPLTALILPAAVAGLAILTLVIGGLYTYFHRNQQIDDRCNLDFEHEVPNYDLYLDEDNDYVAEVLRTAPIHKTDDHVTRGSNSRLLHQKTGEASRTLYLWSQTGEIPRAADDCYTVMNTDPEGKPRRHEI